MDKAGRSPFPHGAGVLLGNSGPEEQVPSRESPLCSGLVMVEFLGLLFRAGSEQPSAYRRVQEKCLEAVFACAFPSGAGS